MSTTGFRPKGSIGPLYHPERDLAYITPTLMARAMDLLDESRWTDELRAHFAQFAITDAMLNTACCQFATAQALYVTPDEPVQSPVAAMDHTGFLQQPYELRLALFAAIGMMVTGGWFKFVRDVTFVGEDCPAEQQIAELVAIGRKIAGVEETGQIEPAELEVRLFTLRREVRVRERRAAQEIHETGMLRRQVSSLEHKVKTVQGEKEKAHATIAAMEAMSLWQLIWDRGLRWIKGVKK